MRRMSTGTQAVEAELIESVCERVREKVAPGEVEEAEAFVRAYYKGAPAEDVQTLQGPDDTNDDQQCPEDKGERSTHGVRLALPDRTHARHHPSLGTNA